MTQPARSMARRWRTLIALDKRLEPIMVVLGFVWLVLLIIEFAWGTTRYTEWLSYAIWVLFIAEFLLRFSIAPRKGQFLTRNWITIVALGLPALRVLRFARALRLIRATRGLRLVRLLTSMNRGLTSLRRGMQRRGAGYVAALTIVVVLAGAAGMLAFEGQGADAAFVGYGEAVWWTAMLVTTVGSEFWPVTNEGRVLALLLAVYAVSVFGYLAASLASYFVGRESDERQSDKAREEFALLRVEISRMREELANLRSQ